MIDNVLHRIIYKDNEKYVQLVLPECLKLIVLEELHDNMGHQGIERTEGLIRSRFCWPSLHKDVTEHIQKCERCQTSKEGKPKVKSKMGHVLATKPF